MTVAPPVVWLLLVNAATTLFMVGVIWFVQIVHYPLFSRPRLTSLPQNACTCAGGSGCKVGPLNSC